MDSRKSDEQGMDAPYNFIGLNHRIMEAYEDVEQLPQNNGISRNDLKFITGWMWNHRLSSEI